MRIVVCACGENENLRKLDVPAEWGDHYICPSCDAEYDAKDADAAIAG